MKTKRGDIKNTIDTALDKFSGILLPVFVIGIFVISIYHVLTKEKSLYQAIKKNILIIIISVVLGTFFVFIIKKIKRNKNNIFFPKMDVLYVLLAAAIWMALIIIHSKPFFPAALLVPLVFLLFIIQGAAEYYKINGEILDLFNNPLNSSVMIYQAAN